FLPSRCGTRTAQRRPHTLVLTAREFASGGDRFCSRSRMPPMAPMKIAGRPGLIADNLMPVGGIALALLALALGWSLFSDRLMQRANRADAASAEESRLWGGPLLQPHPSVRWRRADAATAELSSG